MPDRCPACGSKAEPSADGKCPQCGQAPVRSGPTQPILNEPSGGAGDMPASSAKRAFRRMIERIEEEAKSRPRRHKLKALIVGLLGYLLIFGILATLFGLIATGAYRSLGPSRNSALWFAVMLAAAWVLIAFLRGAVRRLPAPSGLLVRRHHAPTFFDLIEEARKEAGGPRQRRIFLDASGTAGLNLRPWLGLLGRTTHTLIVGLPLLAGVSTDQCLAILTHEFGHTTGAGSRIDELLKIAHQRWSLALTTRPPFLTVRFANWYIRKLSAYLVVVGRRTEYAADHAAARLTGNRVVGDALLRTTIVQSYIDRDYWPTLMEQARQVVTPPSNALSDLIRRITDGTVDATGKSAMRRSLAHQTDEEDTHPCLRDRLKRLQWPAPEIDLDQTGIGDLPMPRVPNQSVLDERYPSLVRDHLVSSMDRGIVGEMADNWANEHNAIQAARRELEKEREPGPDTRVQDLMRYAAMQNDVHGIEQAVPFLKQVIERDEHHPRANYVLGEHLARRDDEESLPYLERAAASCHPWFAPQAAEQMYLFHRDAGHHDAAVRCHERLEQVNLKLEELHVELNALSPDTRLMTHNLDDREIVRMQEAAALVPRIKRLYVCRRPLKTLPYLPFHLIGVDVRPPWYGLQSARDESGICSQLLGIVNLDEPFTVYPLSQVEWLRKTMTKVPSSEVYG